MPISNTFQGKLPSDYEEVLHWTAFQRTSHILLLYLLSIPLAFVFGFVFITFVLLFGKPPEIIIGDSTRIGILMIGLVLMTGLHELVYGIAMRAFGGRPKYGIVWKGLMLYADAPGYAFSRNQYLVASLATSVSLGMLACMGILIQVGTANF